MHRHLFTLAIALIALPVLAQSQPPRESMVPETISVTGMGRVRITPDRFTFTAGVQTVAPTVEEAVNQNNARVATVVAALKKGGAADSDIQTSNFSIWPQQDHSQGRLPRILGYQVSNTITVRRDKVKDAGKLLQVAITAGVNHSSGLQFEVSDPARGRDQGMKAAFEDARAKAAVLAQAAGRTLGPALAIAEGSEVSPPRPMPMAGRAMAQTAESVSDVPIESGTQEVIYVVSVMFHLR